MECGLQNNFKFLLNLKNQLKNNLLVEIAKNGEFCSKDVLCDISIGLFCRNQICSCAEDSFFDGRLCVKKNTGFESVCRMNSDCNSVNGLICSQNGKCICSKDHFWNVDRQICGIK